MEQYRTRTPQHGQRAARTADGPAGRAPGRTSGRAPLGPQAAAGEAAAVYRVAARPAPPFVLALRRLPEPRLTGLGGGLFAAAVMFLLGCLDWLIFDGSPAVYGVLFLPVSAVTALWVRPADLVSAPISVPIAFAFGIVPIAGGSGGLGGQAMAVVTALALHAGWLYGGTLVAGLIASVRKLRLMGRRRARPAGPRPGSGPGSGPRR
ncbi:DUF6542 domain-containing protein [Streptomyces melanogenes]|uniref:DUF6542 domain-containing protein n=1 Tax=Streptomyces melanogenes TaxID=67326 RepID=UPI003571699A